MTEQMTNGLSLLGVESARLRRSKRRERPWKAKNKISVSTTGDQRPKTKETLSQNRFGVTVYVRSRLLVCLSVIG